MRNHPKISTENIPSLNFNKNYRMARSPPKKPKLLENIPLCLAETYFKQPINQDFTYY